MSSKKHTTYVRTIVLGTCLLLAIFVGSRIIPALNGSSVRISSIPDNTEVSDPVITLSGTADDAKKLTMNGTLIPLSPDGSFSQTVLLHPGYNAITFDTTDLLGNTKKQSYAFLLKELETGTFALSALPGQN